MGGYWPEPVHDEKRRSADGRWLATAIHWQPAYGYRTLDDSDFLGHFYGPLIACDRVWFHPDKDFLNKTDFLWIIGEAPPEMIHPRHRQAYIESVRPAP